MTTDERPLASTKPGATAAEILAACLYVIATHGPRFDNCGICMNIDMEIDESTGGLPLEEVFDIRGKVREKFSELAQKWPQFSGNFDYPVPSPYADYSAEYAYHCRMKWIGEYGELRRSLLHFVFAEASRIAAVENGAVPLNELR